MNFGELIAKGGAIFLRKKLSAVQGVFDAAPAGEKAAFQASVSGGWNADQREFERLLSVNGAVFNGTTDDAPALQAAFDSFGTNRRVSLRLPVTGAISRWHQACGTTAFSGDDAALSVHTNISVDWQGLTVHGHELAASDMYLLAIRGAPTPAGGYTKRQFANHATSYRNLILYNGSGNRGAINVSGATGAESAAYVTFDNMNFTGGSNSYGMVTYDNNCWATKFNDCGFYVTNGADAFNGPCTANSSNTGATMQFNGCTFQADHGGPTSGAFLCSNTSSGSFDYVLNACAFEWQVQRRIMRWSGFYGGACVSMFGSYIEGHARNATPTPMIVLPDGNVNSSFRMFGGGITIFDAGTGTAPAHLFDPGNVSSPNGIILSRPQIKIDNSTVPLNKTSATGRFVYDI